MGVNLSSICRTSKMIRVFRQKDHLRGHLGPPLTFHRKTHATSMSLHLRLELVLKFSKQTILLFIQLIVFFFKKKSFQQIGICPLVTSTYCSLELHKISYLLPMTVLSSSILRYLGASKLSISLSFKESYMAQRHKPSTINPN